MESWIGLGELLVRVSAYGGCPARGASCGFTASAEVSVYFVASYQSFVCWCDGLSAYLWLQLGTCAMQFRYARDFEAFCILMLIAVVV